MNCDAPPAVAIIAVSSRAGAAAMRIGIAFLLSTVLSANAAAAQAQYTVDGLALGARLNFDSASYREYKCSSSDQFDGLSWCQKTRTDRERRGPYTAAYSVLHSREGNVVYVNRSQEPAFSSELKPKKIYSDIRALLANRHAQLRCHTEPGGQME